MVEHFQSLPIQFLHSSLLAIKTLFSSSYNSLRENMCTAELLNGHENVNLKNKQILTKSNQTRMGNTSIGGTSGRRNRIGIFEWFATATGCFGWTTCR